MSNSFTPMMKRAFGCRIGAYSPVTPDEFNKQQVTLVGSEQDIAESHFKGRIEYHQGSIAAIRAAGHNPEVIFRLHPTGKPISLTLSYKTNKPNELRLYLRTNLFKPRPGEHWCIFVRDGEIWIGHFSEWMRTEIEKGVFVDPGARILPEPEEDDFQVVLNAADPAKVVSTVMRWQRNPKIAARAMHASGFVCELYPAYPVFNGKNSGRPFLEAHHLVPMKLQADFGKLNLDVPGNICILNPVVHRKLHYAAYSEIVTDVQKLVARRSALLNTLGIVADDVLRMYE